MLGLATVDDMIAAPPAQKKAPAQVLESLEWWQTPAKFKRRSIDTKECDFINVSLCGGGFSEDFSLKASLAEKFFSENCKFINFRLVMIYIGWC